MRAPPECRLLWLRERCRGERKGRQGTDLPVTDASTCRQRSWRGTVCTSSLGPWRSATPGQTTSTNFSSGNGWEICIVCCLLCSMCILYTKVLIRLGFGRYQRGEEEEGSTHTHTHTHARRHAGTHARTHARTHAGTHALTHARTHARTHISVTQNAAFPGVRKSVLLDTELT